MNIQELTEYLEATTDNLKQVISQFNPAKLNTSPREGGWTAGQVGEHLIKASIAELLYGPVKATLRPPDQYVQTLKDQFLDFSIQMSSPEFVIPALQNYEKHALIQSLENVSNQIKEAIQTLDLTAIPLLTPAELGDLTRLELIHFHLYHTQRHIHQLRNIYQQVVKSPKIEAG